jgi:predicted phosphodiesterase
MRYAIVSDIHANLAAFEAVLADIGNGVDRIWCLGDLVGYGPDPNECVALARQKDMVCVVGNHDKACLGGLDLVEFNPDARRACRWTTEHLTPENRAFLDGLSEKVILGEFTLVHGSPRAPIWEYITQPEAAGENMAAFDTPICLVGHTHVPLAFYLPAGSASNCERRWLSGGSPLSLSTGRWILNPGSVGQPRDGDPNASYLILDLEAMTAEVHRVAYPVEETQQRMEKAGLPGNLVLRLSFGW